jgi:hypothetical protein
LAGVERRARGAVERSVNPATGLLHTYYANRPLDAAGETIARFAPQPLPLYLEGQVHWLRLLQADKRRARAIYRAVRQSPLFDAALQMYTLNECLDACPPEIGRARTFTRGWFENESVWTHMSYKYLLELLRSGLYDEFFADARTMLVPFMDPTVYGRSVLENSSFIASSANPDPRTRGRGFIARLSGSTAEFIHMWLLLTVGPQPFYVEQNHLRFRVRPTLPGGWFTLHNTTLRWQEANVEIPAGCFAGALLGSTLLVYHNPARRDTFGLNAVAPTRYVLDNATQIDGDTLDEDVATRLRNREIRRMDVYLT